MDADTWRDAVDLEGPGPSGEYVLGIDLGQNAAMSAAAAYFRTGGLEAVAVFPELPGLGERGLADGCGRLYLDMAARGELLQAGRRVSDVAALLREALSDAGVGRWPWCATGGGLLSCGKRWSLYGSPWLN